MNDMLKKGFMLGLGAAISGKERFSNRLKEMVERNELTKEQARQMMDDFVGKGESKKEEWGIKQFEQIKKWARDYELATKEDIDALSARIKALEEKIN